jgi:TorA maturation chaperone TorD
MSDILEQIEKLRDRLNYLNHKYYVEALSEVSDYEYDQMMKELEALEKSDTDAATAYAEKQQAFLQTSVRTWVPDFCEKIRKGTDSDFYAALAECLSATIMS